MINSKYRSNRTIHRLQSRVNNPIIVKLVNRWKCDEVKEARRGMKIFDTDLGFSTNKRIYVNVNLLPSKGYLAVQARNRFKKIQVSKDHVINCSIWVDDAARIWVSQNFTSAELSMKYKNVKFQVKSADDFDSIQSSLLRQT